MAYSIHIFIYKQVLRSHHVCILYHILYKEKENTISNLIFLYDLNNYISNICMTPVIRSYVNYNSFMLFNIV